MRYIHEPRTEKTIHHAPNMAPDPNSPRYRVVVAFFRACEANDADTAVSLFADPFQFRLLPKAAGRPIITNRAHFRTFLQGVRGSFKTYNVRHIPPARGRQVVSH